MVAALVEKEQLVVPRVALWADPPCYQMLHSAKVMVRWLTHPPGR